MFHGRCRFSSCTITCDRDATSVQSTTSPPIAHDVSIAFRANASTCLHCTCRPPRRGSSACGISLRHCRRRSRWGAHCRRCRCKGRRAALASARSEEVQAISTRSISARGIQMGTSIVSINYDTASIESMTARRRTRPSLGGFGNPEGRPALATSSQVRNSRSPRESCGGRQFGGVIHRC